MNLEDMKKQVELYSYIDNAGHTLKKVGANEYWVNPCPVCGRKDHFTIYLDTNSFHSFSNNCMKKGEKGGSIIDYMVAVEGMTMQGAIDTLKQLAGDSPGKVIDLPAAADKAERHKKTLSSLKEKALKGNTCNYYYSRGLTNKTIEPYNLGYIEEGFEYGKGFIGKYYLPVSDTFGILRSEDGENKYRNIGSPELLNVRYLEDLSLTGKEIYITEGLFDCLSLEELDRPAVALNSTANKGKLLEALETNKAKLKDKLFIIALDTDTEGTHTAEMLLEGAQGLGLQAVMFNLEGYKDINEALTAKDLPRQLQRFEEGLQEQLEAEKLKGTVYNYLLEDFELDQEKRVREKEIETGFKSLDNALGGGLYPGLYVIGAITSLGKTALALQLADNIAAGQQQVLFFSLEMARYEMTCRSLARALFEQTGNEDITTGHILRSIYQGKDVFSRPDFRQALEDYKQGPAKWLSYVQGDFDMTINTIKAQALEHEGKTGNRPVLFIDYLQAIQPEPGSRLTDKQHIDQTVIALKRLSRDLDLPVIVISSFNRASYGKDSEDTSRAVRFMTAWKESGAVEYTADVLMAMDIEKRGGESIEQAKAEDKRLIDLVILKNRRGKAFEEIQLTYLPKQNFFREGRFE